MEAASGCEFGGGLKDTGDDHGGHQIALGARGAGKDGFETEATQSAERGGDMTVGGGALNLESVRGGDEGIAFEDPAESIDLSGRPSGEVGESAFDDLAEEAGRLAEKDGGRGVAVGDRFHVHG